MKNTILLVALLLTASASRAQNSSSTASQTVQLLLYPVIDIQFTSNSAANGSTIDMVFSNASNYADGVVSGTQELEVRSNRNFKISVKTDASTFSYLGGQNTASMPVNNRLFMTVTGNQTGGSVAAGFQNYASLSANNQDVVLDGVQGTGKKLIIAYKAKPDMGYPTGTYSVGVIYTATQP